MWQDLYVSVMCTDISSVCFSCCIIRRTLLIPMRIQGKLGQNGPPSYLPSEWIQTNVEYWNMMLLPSEYSYRPQGQTLLKVSSQTVFKSVPTLWSNNHSSVKSMLTCPPCDDKPATCTNALTSIHVFNDFNRNGSDIKALHVKVKKSALVCMG